MLFEVKNQTSRWLFQLVERPMVKMVNGLVSPSDFR